MEHLTTSNPTVANDEEKQDNTAINNTIKTSSSMKIPVPSMSRTRILQNFRLLWLDSSADQTQNDDSINAIEQLRQVVYDLTKFTDIDACIEFITNIRHEKLFLICSEEFGQTIVPIIHENNQVNAIFIFSTNQSQDENWITSWPKIKGIHTDYNSICKALKNATKVCDSNSLSMSFVKKTDLTIKENLDSLDKSFMYTQILKEILLSIDFDDTHINEFLSYCREQFVDNTTALKTVDLLQKEYGSHEAIWWYTCDCFLYSMLNRALRLMEVDLIITMGFFLKDLHNHIVTLHETQFNTHDQSGSLIVYRGQGLSPLDFDQLQQTQGGLLAFNNFLSTSLDRAVAFLFAESIESDPDSIPVLFPITIDSSICSYQFANVKDISYYKGEDEILFSMHSIFRIEQIKQIAGHIRLWQVDLTLTSDNDPQLYELTEHIAKETSPDEKGWYRLGQLLIKLGQLDKAQQIYNNLLYQANNDKEKGSIYQELGMIKDQQGKYEDAIQYCEKSLIIRQKILPENHLDIASSYNNIAVVYDNMGKYSKALSYYEQSLEMQRKILPSNHPSLATSHNNLAGVYDKMGEYSKALFYYEKSLEVRQISLPENHPDVATSYNNIGLVYDNMSEYSKALSHYQKALEMCEKILPMNHPSLATSYNNMGQVYNNMGEYLKALSYFEKSLEMRRKALPENHPDVADSYNNVAGVYHNMGEESKALSYYEKSLEMRQISLPANHPDVASSYNNISLVYNNLGEYLKALSYCEKALEMRQIYLSTNHPDVASSYNNIGLVYNNIGEYSKALSHYEKALEIKQKGLPANHASLAGSYNNIAGVYYDMSEYSKALSYYERSLEMHEKTFPADHPSLAGLYNNIAVLYDKMSEYAKALSYYKKSLEMYEKTLPKNHPSLAGLYNNIGGTYSNMGEYSKALSYYEKSLEIKQETLPVNHPSLATSYNNMGRLYDKMSEYSKALLYLECSMNILKSSLLENHPYMENVRQSMEMIRKKL